MAVVTVRRFPVMASTVTGRFDCLRHLNRVEWTRGGLDYLLLGDEFSIHKQSLYNGSP